MITLHAFDCLSLFLKLKNPDVVDEGAGEVGEVPEETTEELFVPDAAKGERAK